MVYCEVCEINTSNMSTHCKTKKHLNGGIRTAMNQDQLKQYHKKYYIEKNLKDKYKEKKKCDCCNKMVAKYNWSKHIQTEKHFKNQHKANNPDPPYIRDRLMKQSDNTEESIFLNKDTSDNNIQQTENEVSVKTIEYVEIVKEPTTSEVKEQVNQINKKKPKPPTKKKIVQDSESDDEIGEVIKEIINN